MSEPEEGRPEAGGGGRAELRGVGQLVGAAVLGVTDIVEDMHRNITRFAPIVGAEPEGRTRGITGMIYGGVRGVTRAAVPPAEAVITRLGPLLGLGPSARRDAMLAVLNGVYGDYLVASGNPLAIAMRLRQGGEPLVLEPDALAAAVPEASDTVVVLVHGLCMNDRQWRRSGHDYGAALARERACSVVHLHYNSGRRVSENGRAFADLLERLVREWPVPLRDLTLIGHSMGGLVSRSACHYGAEAEHAWPRVLRRMIFLGTPHHGAPLERWGNHVGRLWSFSPYTAPFSRVGMARSAGVQDLRHGNLLDEDWNGWDGFHPADARRPVALPSGVRCLAVAADRRPHPASRAWTPPGDGLVPVESALGRHPDSTRALPLPPTHRVVRHGLDHFGLLGDAEVFRTISGWMAPDGPGSVG